MKQAILPSSAKDPNLEENTHPKLLETSSVIVPKVKPVFRVKVKPDFGRKVKPEAASGPKGNKEKVTHFCFVFVSNLASVLCQFLASLLGQKLASVLRTKGASRLHGGTRSAASSRLIGSVSCSLPLRTRCRFLKRKHHCRNLAFNLRLPCERARRVSRRESCSNQSGRRLMYFRIKSNPLLGIPAQVSSLNHRAVFHSAIQRQA